MTGKYCANCFKDIDSELETCPECNYTYPEEKNSLYLPPRGMLYNKQYRIGRVLGHGGFGITYLCYDINLKSKVAIKEYLPDQFATRDTKSATVMPYTGEKKEDFLYGKDRFREEAQVLRQFRHPNIIKVLNYFEALNTAYFVMEYLEGETLQRYVKTKGKLTIEEALKIIIPLLDALEEIHSNNYYHRDIKPANIYMTKKLEPILIDFGAARQQVSGRSKSLTAVLTPGYAPVEQYSTKGRQGAWTDIYAMSATVYKMITGETPPESQDRLLGEENLKRPSELDIKITPEQEKWLLKGLAIKCDDRPLSIEEWKGLLPQPKKEMPRHIPTINELEVNFVKMVILPKLKDKILTAEKEGEIYDSVKNMNISPESVKKLIEENLIKTGSIRKNVGNADLRSTEEDTKKCPYCAEIIKKEAIICRFCNRELTISSEQFSKIATPTARNDGLAGNVIAKETKQSSSHQSPIATHQNMVLIPAGVFMMGSYEHDDEKPLHKVYLDDYYIGINPVTNEEYSKFISAGGYKDSKYWIKEGWEWLQKGFLKKAITEPGYWQNKNFNQLDLPVVGVSWYEAYAYCRWAGGRLPTEAEWEKAARGTDGRKYPWGNKEPDSSYCNYTENKKGTTFVGNYEKGKIYRHLWYEQFRQDNTG